MVHRLEDAIARAVPNPPTAHSIPDRAPAVVALLSIMAIAVSALMCVLTASGVAPLLPEGLRAVAVVSVTLVLPGLPIAGLFGWPRNGLLPSVAIALSLSTTAIIGLASLLAGFWHPLLAQAVILVIAAVATGVLIRARCPRPSSDLRAGAGAAASAVITSVRTFDRVTAALLGGSLVLFLIAVARLHPEQAGVYGLVPILGVSYFVGLAALCVALFREYRRRRLHRTGLAASNVMLIVYMSMPVAWSSGTPPFPTAYVHRFLTDWYSELGALPPAVDGRISWSGFFAGAAHVMRTGGLDDSTVFLTSASLIFGTLLMFPLYALGHSVSGSARVGWGTITIYILFNWYQQDYFAPQALAMQLYVTIVAVLIWQLRVSPLPPVGFWRAWRRVPGRPRGRGPGFSYAVEGVVIVLVAAMVVSHQLTPMVTIAALAGLALVGSTRHKLLWLAGLLLFSAWFTFGASGYWLGHLDQILTEIGDVTASVSSGLSDRITGDPVYGRMQYLRIGGTALLLLVATISWFRLGKSRFRSPLAILSMVPFALVVVQSYGGEVLVRCFLYASPALAALAALAVVGAARRIRGSARMPATVFAIGAVALTLVVAVLGVSNRALNTSFEYSRPATVRVSDELVAQAPSSAIAYWGQGSTIGLPRAYDIGASCIAEQRELAECTAAEDIDYLLVSEEDEKLLQYRYGISPDEVARQLALMVQRDGFVSAYDDGEVHVLKRLGAPDIDLEAAP
ncbi:MULTISPECIES: hypothetical protein [Gordonia]|uniref:Serine/threonine protein kinase n=1 Tax=Gordonia hongkongensis TaxID=1701090 RepID=A0ABT6C1T3_9ACTN|nr:MULTISPECIES: hypothetical protein [Gordonia]MBR7192515.1 hypothetical protein [Gordonia sp. SCSIO 19800]MDF6103920.1 hypothetical protein [Gordonia hongkongensis]